MSTPQNQEFQIVKRRSGMITKDCFSIVDVPMPIIADGEVLLKAEYLSADPYLVPITSNPNFPIPSTLTNFACAIVIESKNDKFKVGDVVEGRILMARYIKSDGSDIQIAQGADQLPHSYQIGCLGMPGRTALGGVWFGLKIKHGDTVLVSGAAGMVGSLAGQLCKLLGAKKVVGTAGGPAKCGIVVTKYGFDACYDYKELDTVEKMSEMMKKEFPEGIDCYYDNVGGHVTDAVFDNTAIKARVAICGQISTYNDSKPRMIEDFLFKLVFKSVNIVGICYLEFMSRPTFYQDAMDFLIPALKEGKIVIDETVFDGFDSLPDAVIGLFTGLNTGKMVVRP